MDPRYGGWHQTGRWTWASNLDISLPQKRHDFRMDPRYGGWHQTGRWTWAPNVNLSLPQKRHEVHVLSMSEQLKGVRCPQTPEIIDCWHFTGPQLGSGSEVDESAGRH